MPSTPPRACRRRRRRAALAAIILMSAALAAVAGAQDASPPDRLFDVRKMIRDTLDVIRAYPAPEILAQPVLDGVQSTTPRNTASRNSMSPAQQQQLQQQLYYIQSQQQQYPQQNAAYYAANSQPLPYRRVVGDSTMSQLQSYNGQAPVRAFAPNIVQQPTVTAPENAYAGASGVGVVMPTPPSIARLFAAPTREDVERLLHLPADIVHRMAADAGYVAGVSPAGSGGAEDDGYSAFHHMARTTAQPEASPKSEGLGGFNFNIQDADSNPVFSSSTTESQTQAPNRIIYKHGDPKMVIVDMVRDGKKLQVPVLSVPQADGRTLFLTYDRLAQMSTALAQLLTMGKTVVDPSRVFDSASALAAYDSTSTTTTPMPGTTTTAAAVDMVIGGSRNSPASVMPNGFDQSGDAIATNRLPTDTFRKMFHVTDRVYPNAVVAEGVRTASGAGAGVVSSASSAEQLTPMSDASSSAVGFKKLADKRDRKRIVATESNAFLQEVDEETHDEETSPGQVATRPNAEQTAVAPTDDNIIVLNGKRYKLVAADPASPASSAANKETGHGASQMASFVVDEATVAPSPSSSTSQQTARALLKSAPTIFPADGRPLALSGGSLEPTAPIHVSQQQEMPSLAQSKELFRSNPLQERYGELVANLMQHSAGLQQQLSQQQQFGQQQQQPAQQQWSQQQPQHPGQQQQQQQQLGVSAIPLVEPSTAFVQETPETATNRPHQLFPQQQQQQNRFPGSASDHNNNNHGDYRPVQLHRTSRERVVVNSGAAADAISARHNSKAAENFVQNAPLKTAILRAASSGELRRKQPNLSHENSSSRERSAIPARLPLQRQYSLKELEEYYRRQHAAARLSSAASDEQQAEPRRPHDNSNEKRLKIGSIRSIERQATSTQQPENESSAERRLNLSRSALKKLTRLEALHRQFMSERQNFSRRVKASRAIDTSTERIVSSTSPSSSSYCQKIRALARQYGQLDVTSFAKRNCAHAITQLNISLSCDNIDAYLAQCDFHSPQAN